MSQSRIIERLKFYSYRQGFVDALEWAMLNRSLEMSDKEIIQLLEKVSNIWITMVGTDRGETLAKAGREMLLREKAEAE